jgi:hypothetical protein
LILGRECLGRRVGRWKQLSQDPGNYPVNALNHGLNLVLTGLSKTAFLAMLTIGEAKITDPNPQSLASNGLLEPPISV